ncbi:methylcytosine dioxygenase TET2 [Eucyclogobius newberryi]|uniref:methylcytosine dioxygenase TET2 n=1 Tax=Eucyclogobius newberryi TaxID=166745 RepID=UPI003B5B0D57
METEEARHETEETLRFVTSSNIPQKLQNGCQSVEGEDTKWNHYTPSTVPNFMKRHRESSSPAPVPGLLDPASQQMNGEMLNGEMKHVPSDQAFLVHQSKKLKVDHPSLADGFNKAAEFQCNVQQTQMNVDKRNCNLSNGDVFGLVKNKQIISNGATSPPSTIEGTPGDLLEKTLSQYFPEHVSIAPQTTKTQINSVNGPDANRTQSEGAQRNVTSGLPTLSHMPAGYVMNGFSNSYGEDQHQQPKRQQQPSGYSRGQMALDTNTVNTPQPHSNGPERYPEKADFQKSNHNSFVNHNAPQYGNQPQRYQQNTGNIATDGMTLQATSHTGLVNGVENSSLQAESLLNSQPYSLTERKSLQQQYMNAGPPHSQENSLWRNCSAESQQRTSSPQVEKPVQRVQAHGAFTDSSQGLNVLLSQQQDSPLAQTHYTSTQHKNATEWQQSQSKTPLLDQAFLHQNQITDRSYPGNKQSEHLREQQHLYPQRPLSQPPQYDGQQLKSPIYRPHSQPQPGHQSLPCQLNVNYAGEQLRQHLYSPNSGSANLKQLEQQQSNNHCQPTNHVDYLQQSAQNQPHLSQQAKSEQQKRTSCSLQLPLSPGDFHKHAALRMHLLQKQERHGPPHPAQSPSDLKYGIKTIKEEHVDEFDFPGPNEELVPIRLPQVKQEPQEFLCDQSKKQSSILASMEQSLRQYQLSPVFEKKPIVINSNRVKVESSGPITILSTRTDLKREETVMSTSPALALKRPPDLTPKKEHLLQCFMDSPMKLLDTPIKNLLDTPLKTQYDIASCHCVEQISEKDEGPYYTHLGSAPSVKAIRELMEERSGLSGSAIRIEKVIYTGKEGKSTQGCPIAKWVIRRSSVEEKLLVLVRERNGHSCESACIIVALLVWDGISQSLADSLYNELSQTLTKYGAHTQRRCALNEERTCACQGFDPDFSGASFSFGCSWSMYYNGCKFARSKIPRKFKLLGDDVREEERLETNFQNLATLLGPLYKTMAPEAYSNQVEHEHRAPDCRLGLKTGRPFSGVTACMDFCAHAHRDLHNMQGGSTVVCTLTREDNRDIGKIPEDEQLHVLPLYKPSRTDEFGSEEGQQEKMRTGAIQILNAFRRQVRMLAEPAKSCRQKKLEAKKAAAQKNAMLESEKAEKALQVKIKQENSDAALKAGPVPGVMGVRMDPGQPHHHHGNIPYQQHHLQQQPSHAIPPTYPGTVNSTNFPRYPNMPGSFPSTSKSGSMYPPQPPTSASSYPSPHHLQSAYMNGSSHPYPGYQRNGNLPVGYPPFYGSNPKHLDMYQQRPSPLEEQYGVPQRYNYPPRYGEAALQVNGYNPCGMGPVHPMRSPYPPYGPNGTTNTHYIDPHSRVPSAHGGLGNQFPGYQSPYLASGPQILPPGQDPLLSPVKTEMTSAHMLPGQVSAGCQMPAALSALQNGNAMGTGIKQEPGTPQTPTTPQKPEVWSDNEHNFLDPDIGGVAVAPSHGSVLIECAKRELHATTPLKNPDRNHPTRISLVFYQHKNLNEAKHGLALWEAKMAEKAREKEEEAERNGGEVTPTKSGKKGAKREHSEATETGEPPYKRFIQSLLEGSLSSTTNTYVSTSPYAFTNVTGPYRQFV